MNTKQIHQKNLLKISLKRQTNINLLVALIFNIARTLPHSVLTIFLLTKGISIANVALFQVCFMLPIFLFEIPSGILSDKIGRKPTYLLAVVFMIIGFSMIGLTDYIGVIFVGQFCYGVATALMSGTIEADLLVRYRVETEASQTLKALKHLQVKTQWVTYAGMLIGGVSGSFLFTALQSNFYILPIVIFGALLILAVLFVPFLKYEHRPRGLKKQLQEFAKESKIVLKKKGIFVAILLLGVAQFLLQPYFNNWQKIYEDKGIATQYFGLIYGLFQVIGIVTSLLFLKYKSNKAWLKIVLIGLSLAILATTVLLLRGLPFVLLFPLFLIPFDLFTSSLSLNLSANLTKEHISTQTSVISTLTRVFSVAALLLNYLLVSFLPLDVALVISMSVCVFISFGLISLGSLRRKSKKPLLSSDSLR